MIDIKKEQSFYKSFKCEVLTSNEQNKELLSEFISKKENNSLDSYLKERAWKEDSDGETRVYLIKDNSNNIVLYFSLKCGLLVSEKPEENLNEEYQGFVDAIIIAKQDIANNKEGVTDEELQKLYDAGSMMYGDKVDFLFEIANKKVDSKSETKVSGQEEHIIKVPICLSAIELRHLCKNENYKKPDYIKTPLGFGIFWEIIVPLIIDITKHIGCQYIYLFAADKSDENIKLEDRKLISYYKTNFKFSECEDEIKLIKPEYDEYCYGLVQKVSDLKINKEAIWHEFEDIYSNNK